MNENSDSRESARKRMGNVERCENGGSTRLLNTLNLHRICRKDVSILKEHDESPNLLLLDQTRIDMLRCCISLKMELIEMAEHFPSISLALTLVLNSQRPLNSMELWAAVKLGMYCIYFGARDCNLIASTTCRRWFAKMSKILVVNEQDRVFFTDSSMQTFLKSFSPSGIDVGHKTFARICTLQLRADLGLQGFPKIRDIANSALSDYAQQYSSYHIMQASRLYENGISGRNPVDPCAKLAEELQRLQISQKAEDQWVIV